MMSVSIPDDLYMAMLPDHKHMGRQLAEYVGKPTADDVRKVCAVLGLSDRVAAGICSPTMKPQRIREWKGGKRSIPAHHFAALVFCGGDPELVRWLIGCAGLQWWRAAWAVGKDESGQRVIARLVNTEAA